jgi:ankyrin repeat protein
MHLPSILSRIVAVTLIQFIPGTTAFCDEIHDAASGGDVGKVKALLGMNPELLNSKDKEVGATPLILAASLGHKDVVKLLLANKAKVNAKSDHGITPLLAAAQGGHNDIAELLRRHGAKE